MRLINHLKKDFDIYVHIDKKSKLNLKTFDNVKIYKKYKVYHAEVSQIISTLFLINEAYENNYDRYVFISGQDVPLKTNKEIIDFFNTNKNSEFISYESTKHNSHLKKWEDIRLNHYCSNSRINRVFHSSVRKFIFALLPNRKTIENVYFGSSWWNLTNNAVKYILEYIQKSPDFLKRFYHTWGGDEYFFQSILLNSLFKENCVNDGLRYIDWSEKYGSNPVTFRFEDYDNIKNNIRNNLFARKFDENIDNDIIDKLYKDLES
ncbi:glycosyl transferase [Brachyspira hampsonii]|nr:glycosyl transferase [Brachyspira hampsonii]